MMSWKAGLAIISAVISTTASADQQHHLHIPLKQHKDPVKPTAQTPDGNFKYVARSTEDTATSPLEFNPWHFWYGSFDVGDSKNLSLLIDSASGAVIINPGAYKPSSKSVALNGTYFDDFGTWREDGCGTAPLLSHGYMDDVTMLGLTVENQAIFSLVESPPKNYTKNFPNDGIFGTSIGTGHGRVGWMDNLCKRGTIEECRYGLAFGTAGTGNMIVGTLDDSLFEGNLTKIPVTNNGWPANVVVNGTKTIIPRREMTFDCGTANVSLAPDGLSGFANTNDIPRFLYLLRTQELSLTTSACRL